MRERSRDRHQIRAAVAGADIDLPVPWIAGGQKDEIRPLRLERSAWCGAYDRTALQGRDHDRPPRVGRGPVERCDRGAPREDPFTRGGLVTVRDLTAPRAAQAARIEIRVVGRWTACALLECLAPYRSFLIQHDAQRWDVHAETPGCHGESMQSAIAAIEECLEEHGVREAAIRIDGKPYRSPATTGGRS